MPTSILHIGKYFSPYKGGIENAMSDIMHAQVGDGFQVSAVVHNHELFAPFTVEKQNNISVFKLPIVAKILFVPVAISAWFRLKQIINQCKPDLLHLHVPNATCFWLLFLPLAKKIPWVIHWHSDVIGDQPEWKIKLFYPFYRFFETRLLANCKQIIVTSPNYLETSVPLHRWRYKCHVVPLGINELDRIEVTRVKHAALQVLCIGRLTYYKGHSYLIQAVNSLVKKGVSIQLHIVGNGKEKKALSRQVSEFNLRSHISFSSNVSDDELQGYLQKTDLLCLPSIERTEAFGLVLLEAMRAGKPCICTSVKGSGMSYLIENNVNGLVVPPCDADALARAMETYSNENNLLNKHGLKGLERFKSKFTIKRVHQLIVNVYTTLKTPSK